MQPIEFREANRVLVGETSDVGDLPVYTDGTQCISLWQLTWRERWEVIIRGRLWLCIIGAHTQPPVWLSTKETVFLKGGSDEASQ